jgi:hypothetical protein
LQQAVADVTIKAAGIASEVQMKTPLGTLQTAHTDTRKDTKRHLLEKPPAIQNRV